MRKKLLLSGLLFSVFASCGGPEILGITVVGRSPVAATVTFSLTFLGERFADLTLESGRERVEFTIPEGKSGTILVSSQEFTSDNCLFGGGSLSVPVNNGATQEKEVTLTLADNNPSECFPTYSTIIQTDFTSLGCLRSGCHDKNATNKFKVDTTSGMEMVNYQLLLQNQMVIKGDAESSPLIKVPMTGQVPMGPAHVKTLMGKKLMTWQHWITNQAMF